MTDTDPPANLVKPRLYCQIPEPLIYRCLGRNPDGTTNVQYSLMALKQLLYHDIQILDQLLARQSDISSVIAYDDTLALSVGSEETKHKMNTDGLVTDLTDEDPHDLEQELFLDDLSDTGGDHFDDLWNLTSVSTKESHRLRHYESDDEVAIDQPIRCLMEKYRARKQEIDDSDSEEETDKPTSHEEEPKLDDDSYDWVRIWLNETLPI